MRKPLLATVAITAVTVWSADNGLFKGGRAANVTVAFACGAFECATDFEETTVRLRR